MMKMTIIVSFRQQCHAQAHLPSGRPLHLRHCLMDLLILIRPAMSMTCILQLLTSAVMKIIMKFWHHLLTIHLLHHQLPPQIRSPLPFLLITLLFTHSRKSLWPRNTLASRSRMLYSYSVSISMSYIEIGAMLYLISFIPVLYPRLNLSLEASVPCKISIQLEWK